MIVVVVIGIILGVTIPAVGKYIKSQKMRGASEALMSDIAYAKSLAIARRGTVQIIFDGNKYSIVQVSTGKTMRSHEAPAGLTYTADINPNFYAHGLADAANFTIKGGGRVTGVTLSPNGTTEHSDG